MKTTVSYNKISRQADRSIVELLNLSRRYGACVDAMYPKYRADCNRNASLYTTEALENQRKEAKKEYSAQLLNAFNELWRDVGIEVDLMRDALTTWVSEAGDPAFLAQIKAYKDFDLTLSRTELEALVAGAGGSYVCLRCLDKLAEKSGFRVSVPSVDDLGRDLEQIKMDFWGLRLYAPLGDGDALDLLPDMIAYNGMQMGRPTVGNVTLAWQGAKNLDKHLEEIRGRWSSNVQPMVTATEEAYGADQQDAQEEAERIKQENAEQRTTSEDVTVEATDSEAVELARKLGKDAAQGKAQVVPGLAHYL